jgi:hypothetical protein
VINEKLKRMYGIIMCREDYGVYDEWCQDNIEEPY